jgi:hypothetical protein
MEELFYWIVKMVLLNNVKWPENAIVNVKWSTFLLNSKNVPPPHQDPVDPDSRYSWPIPMVLVWLDSHECSFITVLPLLRIHRYINFPEFWRISLIYHLGISLILGHKSLYVSLISLEIGKIILLYIYISLDLIESPYNLSIYLPRNSTCSV